MSIVETYKSIASDWGTWTFPPSVASVLYVAFRIIKCLIYMRHCPWRKMWRGFIKNLSQHAMTVYNDYHRYRKKYFLMIVDRQRKDFRYTKKTSQLSEYEFPSFILHDDVVRIPNKKDILALDELEKTGEFVTTKFGVWGNLGITESNPPEDQNDIELINDQEQYMHYKLADPPYYIL